MSLEAEHRQLLCLSPTNGEEGVHGWFIASKIKQGRADILRSRTELSHEQPLLCPENNDTKQHSARTSEQPVCPYTQHNIKIHETVWRPFGTARQKLGINTTGGRRLLTAPTWPKPRRKGSSIRSLYEHPKRSVRFEGCAETFLR